MSTVTRRRALVLSGSALATPALAQIRQSPGVTATELRIGQTMPYSGPAFSYASIGRTELAYFNMVNVQGGINGRKIKLLSLDDAFSPSQTMEETRYLVEEEGVACIFQPLGTATNVRTRDYLNSRKVPQIFVASGATLFDDPVHYPWTIGWQISYQIAARIYARYILQTNPNAKIAMLHQNDDAGSDFLKGFKDGLGRKARQLVATSSYAVTDSTLDSQVTELHDSGADALFVSGIPKFNAMTLRKVRELDWNPLYVIAAIGSPVSTGLSPAGLDRAVGLVTGSYMKDPSDPEWKRDPDYQDWVTFMQKHHPGADLMDISNVYGYCAALTGAQVFKQCGNDLSRENIMRQATNLDIQLPMFQNGIRFTTTPTDFIAIKQLRLQRFDGKAWVPFGEPLSA